MFVSTEKLEVMNVRAVKVCTKKGFLGSFGSKNQFFCQKMQRNVLSKGKS